MTEPATGRLLTGRCTGAGPIDIDSRNFLRAGKRAAAIMSLIHSATVNGLDPYGYIRDVLERLPTQPASAIDELLPHRRKPIGRT